MPLVAAVAAARGERVRGSDSLMASAEEVYRQSPTFFGAAWIALCRMLLDTDRLDTCRQ